ncbi:ABC transporter ATP-binding protein [Bacillus sp. V33-4]|uniref:ABC transporter ATP-binding protein n=1 Tax=Bacillus sp. V33-4 TaxID=2054169 RepID=UPI000C76D230|nr:ABC transporter ATP-binding protein [Bacillus sp. V33-4]PLR84856.1 ABC transporter ATP-binding protein [Bacillus sp. V33-4]
MIHINEVSKKYGGYTALKNINLKLREQEFVAILGPSGCGKTTLLKLLAGFMKPSSGEITIHDDLVAGPYKLVPPEKRNISMVFQSFALWPHMTVSEHVYFPLKHHRYGKIKDRQEQADRVSETLEMVGLENLKNRYPSELSGGQRQRVALARAIVPRPALLLMDEPLSALDAELRMEMRKEIQGIHRQLGTTVVYVTHDQSEALAMSDRIVVMNKGEIEQVDPPEAIYTKPRTVFVSTFVGKSNLITGKWINIDTFIPDGFPHVSWPDMGTSVELKKQHLYPIRPEQWVVTEAERGEVTGEILFAQFQGNEIHYSVLVNDQTFSVYSSVFNKRFIPGDKVSLKVNIGVKETAISI